MRTTVEITETQRAELLRIAAERGDKGFSSVIRDALDLYLKHERNRTSAIKRALATKGSLSERDASEMRAEIRRSRERWR